MEKRKFVSGEVNHVYQRGISGFNIFYEIEDYLVYYTIFSVLSLKYGITVYGLCLMIDHIHSLCASAEKSTLSKFFSNVTIRFVKEYQREHRTTGPIFSERFGSAPKIGTKRLRTAIAYLYNNPVERYLCRYAQEYRWNFLAYGNSDCPFSERLVVRKASSCLQSSLKEVDGSAKRGDFLTYTHLRRLFSKLDMKERAQLVDYIVKKYSVIRYDVLVSKFYDGYQNMLTAINSNAGSEYDINEYRCGKSDAEYRYLYRIMYARGYHSAGDIISLDIDTKINLHNEMLRYTHVASQQICKFLHLPIVSSRA